MLYMGYLVRNNIDSASRCLSFDEMTSAIQRIKSLITAVESLNTEPVAFSDPSIGAIESEIHMAIRDIFGEESSEYRVHRSLRLIDSRHRLLQIPFASQKSLMDSIPHILSVLDSLVARLEKIRESGPGPCRIAAAEFWNDIHPRIAAVSKESYDMNRFTDSVAAAVEEMHGLVRDIVRSKTGCELTGVALMHSAFSPENPLICLHDTGTDHGRSLQQGYMDVFASALLSVEKAKADSSAQLSRNVAKHFLYFASLLIQKVEETI